MSISAKFKVSRVTLMGDPDEPYAYEVEMTPDYSRGKNKQWAEATTSGVCRLTITNFAAVDQLPLGKEVDILFS
jgi:hypothetical protein